MAMIGPFEFIIVLVAMGLGAAVLLALLSTCRSRGGGGGKALDAEETRLIQDLHRNLARMEDRIESLETLLLDRELRSSRRKD